MIHHFGQTDVGLVRPNNEDSWNVLPKHHFYALADGLGGKNSGEVASKLCIQEICNEIQKNPIFKDENKSEQEIIQALHTAIVHTNTKIWEMSNHQTHLNGMGTTLTLAFFWKEKIILANVGDSRIYRFRKQNSYKLEQLTHDDSLVYDLLQFGLIDEEEAKTFPLKHVITKSMGSLAKQDPTISTDTVKDQDIYLLCSDGLYGQIEDPIIQSILEKEESLETLSHLLIQTALQRGGHDNITVILLKIFL